MSAKSFLVQLYGFLVKVFLQRWRTPVITLAEILLPFLFALLLSICWWTTDKVTKPPRMFDGGKNTVMNFSAFGQNLFCQNAATMTYKTAIPKCNTTHITCLSLVGNGQELCYPKSMAGNVSKLAYPLSYTIGSVGVFNLDYYLAWSAYMTEDYIKTRPTFLGRTTRASISHYGELLVASSDESLAQDFMKYCQAQSGMCSYVLHKTPFSSFDAAEAYAAQHPNQIWAIVDLPSGMLSATGEDKVFTIGMNFTATPWTFEQNSRSLFSRPSKGGDGYALYHGSGFFTLQTLVENFYTQALMASGTTVVGPAVMESPVAQRGIRTFLNNNGVAMIPMPMPATFDNAWMTQWQYFVPLVAAMAAIFPVARLTALIVDEKPNGIRESMLIMGMHHTCMFGGWFLSSLVMDLVAALLAAMVLKVSFLSYANYGILLVLYFTFLQQNTALSILISTMFSNPRLGSWCAAFVIFVFAIPAYNFPDGMSSIAKIFLSMLPCIGFTLSFFDLTEYASFGRDFTWDIARKGSFNLAIAVGMMWASWAIFMLFAFYLDRVWPGTVGRPEPWYFPLRPLIRCFRARTALRPVPMTQDAPTQRKNMYTGLPEGDGSAATPGAEGASSSGKGDVDRALASPKKSVGPSMIEHADDVVDPSDATVAAVFDNLYKVYISGGLVGWLYTFFTGLFRHGDRTVALDGVTFAMKKGEVSVLLGPNGAGKSTIMGVATGMVRPSAGEVYIGGYAASDDLDACRQHIGYCPQVDIVWGNLTVAEHLTFYSRLKRCETFGVQKHVDKAIALVGLEEKRDCKAENLSGGQRRRLCVGIALVADSSVLLLDEPTAGMDIMGRKIVYDALNRARANRSVLLCTHLLDEADRIGDRILIVNDGKLCGEGSALYLKSKMKVGYVVTCVLENGMTLSQEDAAMAKLLQFVKENGYKKHAEPVDDVVAVPAGCQLLGVERRGREVSFRFPMSLLSSGGQSLLEALQSHAHELNVRSVGLNLTSLEDVFLTATVGGPMMPASSGVEALDQADVEARNGTVEGEVGSLSDESALYESTSFAMVFLRHFRAMFIKRCNFARRDLMLLIFQIVIPIIFLLLSLLISLIRAPTQPSRVLDMSMYPGAPGQVLLTHATSFIDQNAFQVSATTPNAAIGSGNFFDYRKDTSPPSYRNGTLFLSQTLANESDAHAMPRYYGFSTSNMLMQSGAPQFSAAVLHNISYPHAAPMALSSLFNLARYQVYGEAVPKLQVRNRPMPIGEFEKSMWDANKQVMAGIFVILPFVLIPCNTVSYVVREKEVGARHMQWLSGASIAAYWLSSFVFDFACYIVTEILAMTIFVIFNRTEYILKENVGVTITLFLFFGFSSVTFSYLLSFFFTSSFAAQTVVLLVNFVFGFMWVTLESMLAIGAYKFTYYFTAIVRVLPAVSFGEGLYVISGHRIGDMMYPDREKDSMYSLLTLTPEAEFRGGIGTGMIYMGCVTVGSTIALVVLEYVRVQRAVHVFGSCCAEDTLEQEEQAMADRDASVVEEESRVCADKTGPATDMISMQHVRKHYLGSRYPAVADVSLGVRKGEVMGLLGLNGAGKSTTIGVIAGEVVPTSGDAFVNHMSVLDSMSRSFIGYCPQRNPLLDLLSPKEHLWLYARLRGLREELIRDEVNMLIRELGLYPHRHQAAKDLSGGNKRRLTLAIALVGRTTSILLDEPTAGMDALARSQTCTVVKRLTGSKSVILTTHLLDEVEAMADRVTFMKRGRVSCVGTPQELRSRVNRDLAYTIMVTFPHHVDLTDKHSQVPALVERYMSSIIQKDAESSQQSDSQPETTKKAAGKGQERWCELSEVHVASLRVTVQAPLGDICCAMNGLRQGAAPDVPVADFVSVSQPTLEDILLQE